MTTDKGIYLRAYIFVKAALTYKKPPMYKNLFVRIDTIVPPEVDFLKQKPPKEPKRVIIIITKGKIILLFIIHHLYL